MVVIRAFLIVVLLCAFAQADTNIRYRGQVQANDVRDNYFIDLIHLAMEKTADEYGGYSLEASKEFIVQSRAAALVAADRDINILWTMTSAEKESTLRTIRIPLQKGLLGHRIFIINKKDKDKFSEVKTFDQLKKLSAGQGHDWSDTRILRSNGLAVEVSYTYEALFKMLAADRFDYFPRGVAEPFPEVANHPNLDLMVEENLMLIYRAPIYFFVNKENYELANRIEKGLNLAIEDGSFDEFFYNHPAILTVLEKANMENRISFSLDNPMLTEETRKILDVEKYWYSFE